jgi:hypothetical protein
MSVVRKALRFFGLVKDQQPHQCEIDKEFVSEAHRRISKVVESKLEENARAHERVRRHASVDREFSHASQTAIEQLLRQLEGRDQ